MATEHEIDTFNRNLVGLHLGSGSITVQQPRARMTADEALTHAAWLVAIAEPYATHPPLHRHPCGGAEHVTTDTDDLTVEELIDRLPEPDTRYPIVLEATERRLVWVEAESPAAALAAMQDYPHESWDDSEPMDGGGVSAVRPSVYSWDDEARELDVGPVEACRECGVPASDRQSYSWKYIHHSRGCSRFHHRPQFVTAHQRDPLDGKRVWRREDSLWLPSCECREPGWNADYDTCIGDPGAAAPVGADERAALAQAHVAGRPHSTNIPLGITEDLYPADRGETR